MYKESESSVLSTVVCGVPGCEVGEQWGQEDEGELFVLFLSLTLTVLVATIDAQWEGMGM